MKKIFIAIFIVLFCIPTNSHAQSSCSSITTQAQYNVCCGVGANNTNATACSLYRNGVSQGATTTQTSTDPATVPANQCSPILSTNYGYCCGPMRFANSTSCASYDASVTGTIGHPPASGAVNNTGQQNIIGPTPVSGAPELKQCSAIKFLSILDIMIWIKCLINVVIIPMIFGLALLFFLWGVMKFIRASDSTKREEGRKFIIAGLIGLFVMTSLWGIISIVSNTLGTGSAVPLLQTTYLKQ